MMDNPFLQEEPEEYWEDEEDEIEDELEELELPSEPVRHVKEPRQKDKCEIGIDRNGVLLNVGDRVKIVGSRRESTVHFNGSMYKFLNTDKVLTIREVRPYSPHPCFKIHGADDWSWSHMNVEKVLVDPPKKAEPALFDPKYLDTEFRY
jgi:hypothetical protein